MRVGKRHIRKGNEFNHLFPTPKGSYVSIKKGAVLADTVGLIKKVVADTLEDTYPLSQMLKGSTVLDTCRNIWNFCFNHLQYTKDEKGKEQVRRPARVWRDRKQGVDCDCMSVFIGSILTNLNIPFSHRLTKYKSSDYEHIYPIAHTNNQVIILDAVVHQFNREVPYSAKQDINMELQYLNGFEEEEFIESRELNELLDNDYPIDAQAMLLNEAEDLDGFKSWFKKTKAKVKSVAKKVGTGLKKGLHAINRINPVTALLRAGLLASMKLNVMKVASKLRFAYFSDSQAQRNNMDMNKFNGLKRIREKMDKIYFGAGGKPENLKKAILTGKGNRDRRVTLGGLGEVSYPIYDEDDLRTILGDELYADELAEVESGINGLGAIATGTAIASATGVLATVAVLIKNLGNLFKQGSPQAQREVIQDNTDEQEEKTRKYSVKNLANQVNPSFPRERRDTTPAPYENSAGQANNYSGESTTTKATYDSQEKEKDKKDPKESGKIMTWIKENPVATGAIALTVVTATGYGIYRYTKNKKKKNQKGVNGIEGAELGAPKKAKKSDSPKGKSPKKSKRKSPARATPIKKVELL